MHHPAKSTNAAHPHLLAQTLLLLVLFLTPLHADDELTEYPPPNAAQLKTIQQKSLALLRDLAPPTSTGRKMETMAIDGGLIYWGNLFDPHEITALVNLAPEPQVGKLELAIYDRDCWPTYLSLCAWKKDHWVYRQYPDNANTLSFHDRHDSPHHFVQATRKTGRYEGDFLSWSYDPKTSTLVRTNYETWGPFFLWGNYLCTTRGFQHRAMEATTWIYPYQQGKKGNLLAVFDWLDNAGEFRSFAITFHDPETKKPWTYTFVADEKEPPFLHYSVDAVQEEFNPNVEGRDAHTHYVAKIKSAGWDEQLEVYCFDRLTKLPTALTGLLPDNVGICREPDWNEVPPQSPPIRPINFEITGDPEIIRHLKNL